MPEGSENIDLKRMEDITLKKLFVALETAVFHKIDEVNSVYQIPKEVQQVPESFSAYLEKTVKDRTGCMLLTDNYVLLEEAQKLLPCVAYAREGCLDKVPMSCSYVIEGTEGLNRKELQQMYLRICGLPLTIAETERLILRELSEDDIERMYAISREAAVRAYVDDIPEDKDEAYAHIRAYIKHVYPFYGYGYWGIFLKESGVLIGRCGLQEGTISEGVAENIESCMQQESDTKRNAEDTAEGVRLGYLLDPAYTGAGYAREAVQAVIRYAFEELQLNRISAIIHEDNMRSVAVAKACGMSYDGELEQDGKRYQRYVIGYKN